LATVVAGRKIKESKNTVDRKAKGVGRLLRDSSLGDAMAIIFLLETTAKTHISGLRTNQRDDRS
jgi:hypothetical protein